ncbi:MAG: VWA domain-containing protein, partial [Coriobacteriia bacterium]|nr:VWA domain-containing protein [Coriobacteriia bacterium]
LFLDRSASMGFGTRGLTKWDYSCFLGTCLSYLMLKQQDAVGMALFGAEPGVLVPPRCRSTHLHQIMRVMMHNPPSGRTNLAGSLQAMVRRLKRRSLVVLISDLIDDPDQTLRSIRLIGSHKHDVIVFHVHDAAEQEFDFEGASLFRDLETGEEMEVDPLSIRASYLEKMRELHAFYQKGLAEAGIDYEPINTRQPYDHALYAYLQRRARLRH